MVDLGCSDPEKNDNEDSIIQIFLDQCGIKKLLLKIFKDRIIKITPQFVDGFILWIFLILVFAPYGLLKLEFSIAPITVGALAVFLIAEIIGRNTKLFRGFFSNEEKIEKFIKNISSYSIDGMNEFVQNHKFSGEKIDEILKIIWNDNSIIPPFIVEDIITTNRLNKGNLDNIFSKDSLENIRDSAVIRILYKNRNSLTTTNLINTYEYYLSVKNESVLKILFATQKDTEKLLNISPNNEEIREYYAIFQENELKLSFCLRHNCCKKVTKIFNILTAFIVAVAFASYIFLSITENIFDASASASLFYSFWVALIIGLMARGFLFIPISSLIKKHYYKKYIESIDNIAL